MKAIAIIMLALFMNIANAEVVQTNATLCVTKDDLKSIDSKESFRSLIAMGRCVIAPMEIDVSVLDRGFFVSKVRMFGTNTVLDMHTNTSNLK